VAIKVINVDTPTLGDRSYIAHDGKSAVVVDPQRDIDRVEKILVEQGLNLDTVVETHMHNDYVSGGLVLAKKHSAKYLVSELDPVNFERFSVVDNQVIPVGTFAVKALHTPGHTFTHLSYELLDEKENAKNNNQLPLTGANGGNLVAGAGASTSFYFYNQKYVMSLF
jgi:glyoxylase-like metal-dependent hydrolase (beta-lactamase superfamily II)